MVESKAVKLRTIGERECLSLPKEEATDGDAINNRTKSDLEVSQLQLENRSIHSNNDVKITQSEKQWKEISLQQKH